MTYATTTHTTANAGFIARLRDSFADRIRRMAVYQQTRSELEAMTDRDLADIGITRFMIADLAREAAARA